MKRSIDRRELLKKVQECAQEMKRLVSLHDCARQPEKDRIFDKMTDLRNRAMSLLERAHGRRSRPIKIKFYKKRAV
jgi:hypothetical protein